jgi:uncharacterized protein YbjT (DUF2867 family)
MIDSELNHAASARRVLVAGAGGLLGGLIVRGLVARGDVVRAVVRREKSRREMTGVEWRVLDGTRAGAWGGVCDGVDVVVSCLGATVNPFPLAGWKPYTKVDGPANIGLLREAERAGVRRFVYVSLIDAEKERELDYAEGHERVVDALRQSRVPSTVMRPTGFFAAMGDMVHMARRGVVPVFGDGAWRTNPIHEEELAAACVEATLGTTEGVTEVPIGGPETLTRREIAAMAFEALGKRPRLVHMPVGLVRAGGHLLRLVNPRGGHFVLFAAHVMTHDCVAPARGVRRIGDYFRWVALG